MALDCNVSSNYTIIDTPEAADSINSCSDVDGSLSLLFQDKPSAWKDEAVVDLGTLGSLTGDLIIYPDDKPKKTVVKAGGLKSVKGELTIQNIDSSSTVQELDISFPALESVGSNYVITGGIAKLDLEHKEGLTVGSMMRIYSTEAEDIEMDGLYQVDGDFSVDSNGKLKGLEMGSLAIVTKAFSITENPELEDISFPVLKTVEGDMSLYKNPKLTKLRFPALESAVTISLTSNGKEPTFSFPRLTTLGNSTTSSTSNFKDASKIQFASLKEVTGSITFEALAAQDLTIPLLKSMDGTLTVQDNAALATLAIPRATSMGDIFIKGNDKLSNFTANALKSAGTISLKGSFTNVEFFGLEEVTGDFKVVGDKSMDCSWFNENIKKIVKGSFVCVGSQEKVERKSSTGGIENTEGNPEDYMDGDEDDAGDGKVKTPGKGSSSGDDDDDDDADDGDKDESSGGGGMSTGTKIGIGMGVAIGVVSLLVAAIMVIIFLRRSKARQAQAQNNNSEEDVFDGRMMGVHTRIEANSNTNSAPSLGTLDFSRHSFLDGGSTNAGSYKDLNVEPWKTIRRVSDSTGGSVEVKEKEKEGKS